MHFESLYGAFKRRWGLRTICLHGKIGECDHGAIEEQLPILRRKLSSFSPKHAFKAESLGLNYCLALDITVAEACMSGKQKAKVPFICWPLPM